MQAHKLIDEFVDAGKELHAKIGELSAALKINGGFVRGGALVEGSSTRRSIS